MVEMSCLLVSAQVEGEMRVSRLPFERSKGVKRRVVGLGWSEYRARSFAGEFSAKRGDGHKETSVRSVEIKRQTGRIRE